MNEPQPFTGYKRRRTTRWRVAISDRAAKACITVGGIGTIASVLLVFVFLLIVAKDLWKAAEIAPAPPRAGASAQLPWLMGVDEYRLLGWSLMHDGAYHVFRFDTGEQVASGRLPEGSSPTAIATSAASPYVAFGFADGSLRIGRFQFATTYVGPGDAALTEEQRRQAVSGPLVVDGTFVQLIPFASDEFRLQRFDPSFYDGVAVADAALELVDVVVLESEMGLSGGYAVALSADGKLYSVQLKSKKNLLTGKVSMSRHAISEVAYPAHSGGKPRFLFLAGRGDSFFLIWEDGHLLRFDARDKEHVVVAEEADVVEGDARLTAATMLLGRTTLICGDSRGGLSGWFAIRSAHATTSDGYTLVRAKELPRCGAAVSSVASSHRSRSLAVGLADGHVCIVHVTTETLIASAVVNDQPVSHVGFCPKEDGLYALAGNSFWRAAYDPKHPEGCLSALFGPVWYEGYPEPAHVWQSSGGSVDVEMKLGLLPLVFGTLKATFYCMLIGAPLALLAALFTSEFMHPRVRGKVKPAVEMMASLPSVVLGFLAALVFAEFVAGHVPQLLSAFATIPLAILTGAYLWQLLPRGTAARWAPYKLGTMSLAILAGIALAWPAGYLAERWLFAGDIVRWLNGRHEGASGEPFGSPLGGWLLLCLPLAAVTVALLSGYVGNPWLQRRFGHRSEATFAALHLAKFVVAATATLVLALAASWFLGLLGDPRGTFIDTYVQRNALVVGIVMGFAIIPIIYTIAEDALSSVPEHLRSASLGAGATPWQTAVRIVIPTAMSGLFSALMIGLGRAVGETMIVLMAGGNTPHFEANVFSGFRTLAANIAVELPEAVKNSTHYRTLFLSALTLFLLTFVINTAAEIVRLRFRRRAYQL